jgi:hypothetical protein
MKPALLIFLVLAGCTFATTSDIPVQLPDGSTGYRYSGRANFPHQQAEADSAIKATCARANGGRPLIVSQQVRNIGMGGVIQGTATTTGTLTTGMGTVGGIANMQQDILFRCVR